MELMEYITGPWTFLIAMLIWGSLMALVGNVLGKALKNESEGLQMGVGCLFYIASLIIFYVLLT